MAIVTLGRPFRHLLVAVPAGGVERFLQLDHLSFRLGLVASGALLLLAGLVLVVAVLAGLGPCLVSLVVELHRPLGLLDLLDGDLLGSVCADDQSGGERHCKDDREESCELLHPTSPPSVLVYSQRLHRAQRSASWCTPSSVNLFSTSRNVRRLSSGESRGAGRRCRHSGRSLTWGSAARR